MQQQNLIATQGAKFPFALEDLKSWTIKRTDGTITKYILTTASSAGVQTGTHSSAGTETTHSRTVSSYGSYCSHTPKDKEHLVSFNDGSLKLWVANMYGARQTRDGFDFVIDAGDILTIPRSGTGGLLDGDEELVDALSSYTTQPSQTRVLKIDWDDRQAPLVQPQFWTELNKLIYGDVMTCCVGGHGRSGTTFACLLLVNSPDYDALDAIIHTRAVHCPRAIESVVQHEYIDSVAKFLGREGNSKNAGPIQDYKAAFKASKKPTALRTRTELEWK